jgi:hypothetical protein
MKKMILGLLIAMVFAFGHMTTYAEEENAGLTFQDDFENYDLGKVETQQSFTDHWTNDGWSGANEDPVDINDVATIQSEDGNKFVNFNYNSSFFYMSPHDFRAKTFEVEFDTRSHDLTDAWVGVNMRKEYRDIRYNGGTGLMFYFRTIFIKDEEQNVIGESLTIQALRGGSLSTTDLDDLIVGNKTIEYIYPEAGEIDPEQRIASRWFNIRIVVTETENDKEAQYDVYIDDELRATLTYARSSLDVYGYVSLHACTGDIDVDNFNLVSNDEVAPPPIIRVNRLIDSLGTVGESFEFPGAEENDLDLIDDADGVVEISVLQPNSDVLEIDEGVYQFTPTMEGIHTLVYKAENSDGAEATAEFLINVSASTPDDTTDPVVTIPGLSNEGIVDLPFDIPEIVVEEDSDYTVSVIVENPSGEQETIGNTTTGNAFTPDETGTWTLIVTVTDEADNETTLEFDIAIQDDSTGTGCCETSASTSMARSLFTLFVMLGGIAVIVLKKK